MTLRTIPYNTATHKIVPKEPTDLMLDNAVELALLVAITKNYRWQQYMSDVWSRMIAATPEYQEPDSQIADTAITPSGTIFYNVSDMEHLAEQCDCAMKCLDENSIPRKDENGKEYSLWGRILRFKTQDIGKDE